MKKESGVGSRESEVGSIIRLLNRHASASGPFHRVKIRMLTHGGSESRS
jgi:hypothetical protein